MAEEAVPPPPPSSSLPTGLKTRSKSSKSITLTPSSSRSPPITKVDISFQPGTYIIQVPKEQILHIPPSKNACIPEQHRRRAQHGRRRCPSSISLLFLLLLLLLGIASAAFFLIAQPKFPSFAVESLLAKELRDGERKEYDFKLRSYNPSLKTGYCYEGGGNIAVLDEGKAVVATGRTPGFCQAPTSWSLFWLKTEGSKLRLSKKDSKILLLIQFPARLRVGGVGVLTLGLEIHCDVRVSGFTATNGSRVESQDCMAKMQYWTGR